jgi:hypothetical protein
MRLALVSKLLPWTALGFVDGECCGEEDREWMRWEGRSKPDRESVGLLGERQKSRGLEVGGEGVLLLRLSLSLSLSLSSSLIAEVRFSPPEFWLYCEIMLLAGSSPDKSSIVSEAKIKVEIKE